MSVLKQIEAIHRQYRNNIFAISDDEVLTYDELILASYHVSADMRDTLSGQAIAVIGSNSINFYITVLACLLAELPCFIFYEDWKSSHMYRNLKELEICNIIVTDAARVDNYIDSSINGNIYLIRRAHYFFKLQIYKDNYSNPVTKRYKHKSALYIATSGTTSLNKWVCHCLHRILGNMRALADKLEITEMDRIHSILPLYTANGLTITFFLPFCVGASVYLDKKFSPFTIPNYFLNGIRMGVTVQSLVPSIVTILNQRTSTQIAKQLLKSNYRFCICGTAPLSVEEKIKYEEMSHIAIYLNYGLTETLFISTQNSKHHGTASSGSILSGCAISFAEDGEIIVSSDYLMLGYVDDTVLCTNYLTGDLGVLDKEVLFITGRKKDMVIVGGYKVNPFTIERFIISKSGIKDCSVFSTVVDGAEVLFSAIVPEEGFDDIKATLRTAMKAELPSYMQPKLLILQRLPRNATGKVLKNKLIDYVLKEEIRYEN